MKIKSVAKGFTLIELLVVVLIIGILSAVALPAYRKAVEKSRVTDALNTMQAVAKSEHGWYLANNSYTTDFSDLDVSFIDKDANKAEDDSFETVNYTYELLDTGILASRNNEQYLLYKDYATNIIFCAPISSSASSQPIYSRSQVVYWHGHMPLYRFSPPSMRSQSSGPQLSKSTLPFISVGL